MKTLANPAFFLKIRVHAVFFIDGGALDDSPDVASSFQQIEKNESTTGDQTRGRL
jgi:hypothetical protein